MKMRVLSNGILRPPTVKSPTIVRNECHYHYAVTNITLRYPYYQLCMGSRTQAQRGRSQSEYGLARAAARANVTKWRP